jgi:N-acetylmuramoyl-L-alanine amidase
MRLCRLFFLLLIPLMGCRAAASPTHVTAIRTGVTEERVRVVIDLSRRPQYISWTPTDPHRIAIDIQNAVFGRDVEPIHLGDPVVRGVRINSLSGPKAQVVLDLTRKADSDVFALPPEGSKGHRLVCDVHRSLSSISSEESDPRPWTVVIDPGHGGRDPGAKSSKGDKEKDICLDVAKRLMDLLDGIPDIEARLTRDRDIYLGLRERIEKAKSFNADAFVSIHVNAAPNRRARGAEVFFLSLQGATDEATRELERLENLAGVEDEDFPLEEEMRELPFGLDLRQSDTLLRSSLFAESVLRPFEKQGLAASRGVKQARFVVLKSFHIPSVLVELGFFSNPEDLKRLRDPTYRGRMAEILREGILAYRSEYAPTRDR